MAVELFDGTATATGEWVNIKDHVRRPFLTVQITSSDAGSSTIIQGRLTDAHDPVDIATITGSGAETCAFFDQIRVDVTTSAQLLANAAGQ